LTIVFLLLKSGRPLIVLALAAAVAVGGGYAWFAPERAPAVSFTTLEHGVVTPEALRGKVVLVNFWATTCTVCLKEMPGIVALHEKYAPRGLETVAVAMPYDPPNRVVEYQRDKRLPFKVAIDPNGEVARRFDGVTFTPTTVLIDRNGRVLKRYVGEPDFADVEKRVEGALEG
jgi:thiol-disulfide isomerase/thioredoxin